MAKGRTIARVGFVHWVYASPGHGDRRLETPPARAETITVTHWGGQFYGVPYAVAMEKGFFKKNGVDVTGILTAAGGGTAVRNTLAGGIPFGEVSLAAAVQAINSGQKLIIIGAGAQTVADQMWVVKKDSTLAGIKDLIGKQIAYTAPGSVSNMVILMALKANGITQQQVKLVPAGDLGANLSAVSSGAVDAGFSDESGLRAEQGTGEAPLHGARHHGPAHDADRDDHDRGICQGPSRYHQGPDRYPPRGACLYAGTSG